MAPLSTVVYRSKAVRDMSPPDLRDLTLKSQERNRREAVTGLMLYDGGQFFQWLEGPPVSVDRLMGSICQDPRHTNIEILNNQSAAARTFGDWNMKLAAQYPEVDPWQRDVIAPPPEIVASLRSRPQAAPVLLTRLVPLAEAAHGHANPEVTKLHATHPNAHTLNALALDSTRQIPLAPATAEALKDVILSVVFPQLWGGQFPLSPDPVHGPANAPAFAKSRELAELLVGSQDGAALELLREVMGREVRGREVRAREVGGREVGARELKGRGAGRIGALYETVLEPAARRLGDMWGEDFCSEFELTLALCRLQTAVRVLTAEHPCRRLDNFNQPSVLIVPEPGEMHLLGSVLDSTILDGAGWAPQREFPRTDRALQDLVSASWFDVLDLSLSAALRREHWLPRVTQTIAQARRASQNPQLLVVVGGRVFAEEAEAGTNVGANLASTTAANVDRTILATLNGTWSSTASWELSREVTVTPG